MKTVKLIMVGGLIIALGASISLFAKETSTANPFKQTLKKVAPPELPLQASKLIAQAQPADQEATTIAVVQAASEIKPPATAAVVGSIARTTPEMAPVAAATASARQPKLAAAIAKAAASAAPAQAAKIVAAVCREVPTKYREVATAVAKAAPNASQEILVAVSTAVPPMKLYIEKALTLNSSSTPSVSGILSQADKLAGKAVISPEIVQGNPTMRPSVAPIMPTPVAPAPTLTTPTTVELSPPPRPGPAFKPLPTTITEVQPNNSGEVPPGGRDYSAP